MEQRKSHAWWRSVLAGLFIAVAAISLVGTVVARYVQRNVLDTNGYLAIVGPLPEDPKVSAALAQFTTQKIFDSGEAEKNIKEFLPPRLAPLASPLTDTLEKRVNQTTQDFVAGDAFNTIWTTSNRLMQKGVVRLAESEAGEGKLAAAGSLDLSKLADAVSERLGGEQAAAIQAKTDEAAAIRIDLQQRVERLRTTYRAINTGAYVFPYLTAAFLLAALAVAYNRRRVFLAIGVTVLLLGVAMLLAFKIISGGILGDISDPTSKAAAVVIYETFYGDLRGRLIAAVVTGGILILLALIAGPYSWAKWLRSKLGLNKLKTMEPYRWALNIRHLFSRYEVWLMLAGAAATVIWLLALSTLTPATLVVILSLLIAVVSLLHLIARPAPAHTAA